MKDKIFGVLQRVGRSFMLPIAGLLPGIGSSLTNPVMLQTYGLDGAIHEGTVPYAIFNLMAQCGSAVFSNLPLLFAMGVAIGMFYLWPFVQAGITALGGLVLKSGYAGTWVYGVIERALIPFGLHHVFYMPFWQTAMGGEMVVNGVTVQGAQNIFFAELASDNVTHFSVSATRFMSGKFPFMIFGLPGAALAMYRTARPEKRKIIGIITDDGTELLLHIGINTVQLNGKHFTVHVEQDQPVKKGDLLISFDMDAIKAEGYLLTTPMIVCNTDDYSEVKPLLSGGKISAGTALLEVKG